MFKKGLKIPERERRGKKTHQGQRRIERRCSVAGQVIPCSKMGEERWWFNAYLCFSVLKSILKSNKLFFLVLSTTVISNLPDFISAFKLSKPSPPSAARQGEQASSWVGVWLLAKANSPHNFSTKSKEIKVILTLLLSAGAV